MVIGLNFRKLLIAASVVPATAVCVLLGAACGEPVLSNSVEYNDRGFMKYQLGNYEEAIEDYDRAIELDPNYTAAYYNRGVAKRALGDSEEAIADYNRAIELTPNFAFAYNNRGLAHYDLNNCEEALADFDKAIELAPDFEAPKINRQFLGCR